MKRDVIMPASKFNSSFLSCQKDIETILRKIFIESKPYSDYLKRLLIINTNDCLDMDNPIYNEKIQKSLKEIIDEGYISFIPKIKFGEHEKVKSYLMITMDNFSPNATNPYYRDCTVNFDIICHTDYWDIGDYQVRPLKIVGYIDGILNECKLSGIGTFNFLGCNQLLLNQELSGYTLSYRAIHGNDDKLSPEGE